MRVPVVPPLLSQAATLFQDRAYDSGMSTTDVPAPMHTSTSDDLENKRLYEPGSLDWKETLIQKFGDLADNSETEEATT